MAAVMKIRGREVGWPEPTYIIAEAGINYATVSQPGAFKKAMALIDAASLAGADAVKFQMFTVDEEAMFCPWPGDEARWPHWRRSMMDLPSWAELKLYAETNRGITFLASAFQPMALNWLRDMKVSAYKVASRAAKTFPYDGVPGPFIISTGAITEDERRGLSAELHRLKREHTFLHCVMEYPCRVEKVMVMSILSAGGYSDHTGKIYAPLMAVAVGASVVEVHFAVEEGSRDPCLFPNELETLCRFRDAAAKMRS